MISDIPDFTTETGVEEAINRELETASFKCHGYGHVEKHWQGTAKRDCVSGVDKRLQDLDAVKTE